MIFDDVKIYDSDMFTDFRGDIWTTYKKDTFEPQLEFKHDKYSSSRKHTLRGIHGDFVTWKLVTCLFGEMYFVVVDNREDSPTYMQWDWMVIGDRNRKVILLPPGYGNGFYVLSDWGIFSYKLCYPDNYIDVDKQFSIKWNDDRLNITWPFTCCDGQIIQKRDR